MKTFYTLILAGLLASVAAAADAEKGAPATPTASAPASPTLVAAPAAPRVAAEGAFYRTSWFIGRADSFRVNSPDTATGGFKDRWEAKQTGLMPITMDDDLGKASGAELCLELWGGHPGVANKRFTLNGRPKVYTIPEVGTAAGYCTYSYPSIPVDLADLKKGANEVQFMCDKGTSFWGHYIVRAACLRVAIGKDNGLPAGAGLAGLSATVEATPVAGEKMRLALKCPAAMQEKIASVEFQARYRGYDENGDGDPANWHGYTFEAAPVASIGVVTAPPLEATWDLSMVPDQKDMAVRAIVRFKEPADLEYQTAETRGLATPERKVRVMVAGLEKLPKEFWSRAGSKKSGTINLDADPASIERAQLCVVVWDGGKGTVEKPLALNGTGLDTPDWKGHHDPIYTIIDIKAALLKKGANEVTLVSDTQEHGIEICKPGPALIVRVKAE